MPLLDKAYPADFPRGELGLVAAPRVASFHGLIFASWAADGPVARGLSRCGPALVPRDLRLRRSGRARGAAGASPVHHSGQLEAARRKLRRRHVSLRQHPRLGAHARPRRPGRSNPHERQRCRRHDLPQPRVRGRRSSAARRAATLVRRGPGRERPPAGRPDLARGARVGERASGAPATAARRPAVASDGDSYRDDLAKPELQRFGDRVVRPHASSSGSRADRKRPTCGNGHSSNAPRPAK